MITAKTESGFSIELEDDALEDQELFDAISGMQDGNVFSMSHLTERLLGTEGRKKLYDHLRNDKGRVPPQAVAQAILEEVERFQREGIPAEAFERSKRALYGELVAALNSTGSIANGLVNMHLKGRELFTYIDSLAPLRLEDGEERLRKVFQRERSVLSVILPH